MIFNSVSPNPVKYMSYSDIVVGIVQTSTTLIHNIRSYGTGRSCMLTTNQGLLIYSDAFGIPRSLSVPLIKTFWSYCEHNGEEYACSRFKDMKLSFIREKANMLYVQPWFKMRSRTTYSGCFGALQSWCRSNAKRWSKAIKMLQIYTTLYSSVMTDKQEQKFLSGVNAKNIVIPDLIVQNVVRSVTLLGLNNQPKLPDSPSLLKMSCSPLKRAPHPNGKTYPEDQCLLESLAYTRYTNHGWTYRSRYKEIFDSVESGIELVDDRDSPDICEYHGSVGRIGLIQEQGFKLRAVANPGRVYQAALQPLGRRLYDTLPCLPWDCTHNQSLPFDVIISHLKSNKTVHSVDLSGATDYFPLDLQIVVLKEMFPSDLKFVNLFKDLSRGTWQYKNSKIRWNKGQPLGLFPSFASFALTHGLLLHSLNNFEHNNMFYVLGDDVVILDDGLYERYREALSQLDCPVSDPKTLNSSSVAEFAGKVLTPNGVVEQTKWRNVSDDSFLDSVRNIGSGALRLLKPRQRKIAKILWDIPDFMGGLGFNPKGLTLEDRIFKGLTLFDGGETASFLMSLNRKVNSHNYYDRDNFHRPSHFRVTDADFDKKPLAYVRQFLPVLEAWYEISGRNLFHIRSDLDLPLDGQVSRLTTLERLEKRFRM